MSTRVRPMAVDGHSLGADLSLDEGKRARVRVVILDILGRVVLATDDVLAVLYDARVEAFPDVPRVTPQRLRTVRAQLVREGLVKAAPRPGVSACGHRATLWMLAAQDERRNAA